MKKLLTATALATMIATSAMAEVNFQKVYEVPGMNADQIKQAYGDPTIDVGVDNSTKFSDIMNTASGKGWLSGLENAKTGKLRCNIAPTGWMPDVNEWQDAEVVLQIKDEKARVTVANLVTHGPGKKTCIKSIEKHLDAKFLTLKSLDNNW